MKREIIGFIRAGNGYVDLMQGDVRVARHSTHKGYREFPDGRGDKTVYYPPTLKEQADMREAVEALRNKIRRTQGRFR